MNNASKKKLNKEQLEAVRHKKGPLLIIAGAGTGKTTVVTERIKYLIEKELAKPSEILALTFTEKAACEMEERVDVALPYGYTQMWISTFHSFCDRILRAEALHIGLDPRFKLLTEAETVQFLRSNLFKFKLNYFRPLGNPTKFISGIIQHFARLQDEDVSPIQYLEWVQKKGNSVKRHSEFSSGSKNNKNRKILKQVQNDDKVLEMEKWQELAQAYQTYEQLKVKEGFFDFGDLIVKTLKLFHDRPNILKNYKKQFKYILVDEFQDTNIAQNDLVMLLSGKDGNITVVADDDQSIYKWRGAAISNVLQFRKHYPKAKLVTLTKNYRSNQEILDKSYDLIQYNNPDRLEVVENIDKKLVSQRKAPPSHKASEDCIHFIHSDRVENEADAVAREIDKLVNQVNSVNRAGVEKNSINSVNRLTDSLQYRNFAILVRANNHADPFIRALQRYAIPYQFLGPGRLFRQSEVVDLISYLKVLYDFDDSVALYRVLSIEEFDISARDLIKISNYAKRLNLSLFEACDSPSPSASEGLEKLFLSENSKKKIKKIIGIIKKHLKLLKKESAGQLLYYFLEETELLQKLLNPDTPEAEKIAKNISKFFDKLKTYEVDHEDAGVVAVCDWIELSSELGEPPLASDSDWTDINAVNILTVHSAKGLEFPVVFLVNLVSQRFPTTERHEQIPISDDLIKETLPQGDFHEQEERRLFYVGMTRARDKLYFTAADYYGEGKREKRLSPFIFEALGDEAIASEPSVAETMEGKQLSFLDYEPKAKSSVALAKKDGSVISHQPPTHIDFLSYSQINTFEICPLHYKLRYILKIPTPPSAALSFGSTMHYVMKNFYLQVKEGEKPTEKLLYQLLENNWIPEGYSSKAHEEKMFKRGKTYLKKYLQQEFNPENLPVAVEQPFVIPLNQSLKFENRRPLKIGGKFDRIDILSKEEIEIVDYKTGERVPDQKNVDRDLQLTFYALAAAKLKEPPFSVKPENIKLSLFYFEDQVKLSTTRTPKQLEGAEKEIFAWRDKIENSDFKCSGSILCQNCEYSLFCRAEE